MLGQDEHETDTKNRTLTNSASELTKPLEMVKKHSRLLNRSILRSELVPNYDFWHRWVVNRHKKSDCKEFCFWAHEPLRNGKKEHVRLWNRSIMISELGVRPKLRCWANMSMKQTRKIGLQRFSFLAHEPLRKSKKKTNSGFWIAQFWCLRLELGQNYDVWPRWAWKRHEKSDFNEFIFWA